MKNQLYINKRIKTLYYHHLLNLLLFRNLLVFIFYTIFINIHKKSSPMTKYF